MDEHVMSQGERGGKRKAGTMRHVMFVTSGLPATAM